MSTPVLYSFRRCPYAMRARMAIISSGISVALREVQLRDVPDEMRAASPKATVPVLVLPDGEVIDESIDIMHWCLQQHDPDKWLLTTSQHDCDLLIHQNDNDFKTHLDRYKYADRHPEFTTEESCNQACRFLATLESRLKENQFLCSNHVTFADIAIFPFIRQFSMVDPAHFSRLPFPRLQQWLAYCLSQDMFAQVMQKFPVWQAEQDTVYFPPA